MASGTNASPEENSHDGGALLRRSEGSIAATRRIGPNRLVEMIYTAERVWKKLKLPVPIHVIR